MVPFFRSAPAWLAVAILIAALALLTSVTAKAEDETFGLPEGKGRDDVMAYCAACHSLNLVSQQRLPEYRWQELLMVMTEKHGMPKLPSADEEAIIDYLSQHLGPPPRRRKF